MVMKGMTWKSLKANPSLIPLFFFVGAGSVMAGLYVIRLATRHPEVSWSRSNNGRPWEEYKNKQYKFYSEAIDYKKLPATQAPSLE